MKPDHRLLRSNYSPISNLRRACFGAACLSALASALILNVFPARASAVFQNVTLTGGNHQVRIVWTTSSEVDNSGFFIQRSLQETSGFTRINSDDFIFSEVAFQGGWTYTYIDPNVTPGTVYWYEIEAVDLDDNSSFSDRYSVAPTGQTSQNTPGAPTSTSISGYPGPGATEPYSTPTPNTYPGPGGTQAPAATNAAFATVTPRLSTSTPATLPTSPQGATLIPGQPTPFVNINPPSNPGATTTLVPLPALTMIFPAQQEAALLVTATPISSETSSVWATPQRLVPLGLIVMIWVILGAWFFYSQRTLS